MKYVAQIMAFSTIMIIFSGCGSMVTMISSDGQNPIISINGVKAQLPAKVCFKCSNDQAQIEVYSKYNVEVQILNEDNPNYENSSVNANFLLISKLKAKDIGLKNADKRADYVIIPAYPKCNK